MIHGRLCRNGETNAVELTQFMFKGLDEIFPLGKMSTGVSSIRARLHIAEFEIENWRLEQRCWQHEGLAH